MATFTYTLTGGNKFFTGVEKAYSITAQSDTLIGDLGRFKVTISGTGLAVSDLVSTYDAGDGTYLPFPMTLVGSDLVGYFGPSSGMQYDTEPHTSNFKTTWAVSGRGAYTLKIEFVKVSDGSNIGGVGTFPFVVASMLSSSTVEVDPISRIEGHLGAKVTTGADGMISEANVHGNLWRGFENFLVGRRVNDAITFTQRICGVCPVPHGTAATFAADSVLGVSDGYATFKLDGAGKGVPEAALHVRNIVLGSEFLMSSLVHFYHLVAQSYVQGPPIPPWTPYFPDEQYHDLLLRPKDDNHLIPYVDGSGKPLDIWSMVIKQYVKALRIRRLTFEAGALFAGRMPMMSMSVAGGTTNSFKDRADFISKCDAYRNMMEEVGRFVISEYLPLTLMLSYFYPEWDNTFNGGKGFGQGLGNFLAWGGFPQADDSMAIKGGWKVKGDTVQDLLTGKGNLAAAKASVQANLLEYIARSRYSDPLGEFGSDDSAYPGAVTRTVPERDDEDKYSWMKAPRFAGEPMEVGPLARMVINGLYLDNGGNLVDPNGTGAPKAYADLYTSGGALDLTVLHPDLVSGLVGSLGSAQAAVDLVTSHVLGLKGGLSTMDRLRARAIESFHIVTYLIGAPGKGANSDAISFTGGWIDALKATWPSGGSHPQFFRETAPPTGTVSGFGLVEAPRGALGHFVTSSVGKIKSYQCVVPTTWNGSPKDGPDSGVASGATKRGAMEQALIGVPFVDPAIPVTVGGRAVLSGVEVLRVAQSFDPCIACAVH